MIETYDFLAPDVLRRLFTWGMILAPFAVTFAIWAATTLNRKGPLTTLSELLEKRHRTEWAYLTLITFAAVVWLVLFAVLFPGLIALIKTLVHDFTADAPPPELEMRYKLIGVTVVTATLGAIVAFPFTVKRTRDYARQTRTQEQGQITDRINKAVEGLGAEKTIRRMKKKPNGERYSLELTVPNIEVRIGAIYSLERIAQDSERDHIQIMEILCAYIRENAPARDAQPNPLPDWPEYPENPTAEDLKAHDVLLKQLSKDLRNWISKLRRDHKPRADIQTALSVLGRRDPSRIDGIESRKYRGNDRYRLDLRDCNLQAADLAHLDLRFARVHATQLQGADLTGAKLQGADLREAELQGADLREAELQGANLPWAKLRGADLTWAELQGADLKWAELQRADLKWAKLQRADLTWAELQGADLKWAELQRADLKWAKLQGTDLRGAKLQGADLRRAKLRSVKWAGLHIDSVPAHFTDLRGGINLSQDHLSSMIGNAATLLPNDPDLFLPDRWASEPPHWVALVQSAASWDKAENELRHDYLCAPGQTPQKTGTPWPIDRDPPWVEQGINVNEWVKQQPTRGPVDPTDPP